MNELLIDKYQPKYLMDLNFDEDYKDYINNISKNDNLNILLIGNNGSGKTILIDAILLNYYSVDNIECVKNNILYISNLKEQGISFYKNDVKHFCQSTSEIDNKKSIVIDNLDNLSDINQNIFKLHMDNYSDKVNFICSCTNLNKISYVISNHFITINIKSIDKSQLIDILNMICIKEKYNISDQLKENIIKYSNNSVKLLINNLEKYRLLFDKLEYSISNINNNILLNDLIEFYKYCQNLDNNNACNKLISIYNDGYSIVDIIEYMYLNLKYNEEIENNYKYEIIKILSKYFLSVNNTNEDELIIYFITNEIIDIIKYN